MAWSLREENGCCLMARPPDHGWSDNPMGKLIHLAMMVGQWGSKGTPLGFVADKA